MSGEQIKQTLSNQMRKKYAESLQTKEKNILKERIDETKYIMLCSCYKF